MRHPRTRKTQRNVNVRNMIEGFREVYLPEKSRLQMRAKITDRYDTCRMPAIPIPEYRAIRDEWFFHSLTKKTHTRAHEHKPHLRKEEKNTSVLIGKRDLCPYARYVPLEPQMSKHYSLMSPTIRYT